MPKYTQEGSDFHIFHDFGDAVLPGCRGMVFKHSISRTDGDSLLDNYRMLKRKLVKNKRDKHLTGAVFCKEYSSFLK